MFLSMLLAATAGRAQLADDFELRQNVGLSYQATSRINLEGRYRLSLNDNATRFNTSMVALSGEYELLKWLKAGVEYRFYTSKLEDNHRLQLFARASYKIGKTGLAYRLQYQQTQSYFDREYLSYNSPSRVFRNRLQVKYNFSKKMEMYVFAEPFVRLRDAKFNLYRVRYAVGVVIAYKKRHAFNPELFLNDEFNIKSPEDRLVLELSYTLDLSKQKKKKKKSDKSDETFNKK